MARITNEATLKHVKDVAMQMVVKTGYEQATIARIAEKANVSTGYIYRHYKGKTEMIKSIYEERIQKYRQYFSDIIDQSDSVASVVRELVHILYKNAKAKNIIYKFIFTIDHQHIFEVSPSLFDISKAMCEKVYEKGWATGEIGKDVNAEMIFIVFFSVPQKLIAKRIKETGSRDSITEEDEKMVCELCMKLIR
ncbi:MAG: TetR/AcrR family transcriptional regulator [Bacteroidota bacterium]